MDKQEAKQIVQRAYDAFVEIPDEQWTVGQVKNSLGSHDATGHWSKLNNGEAPDDDLQMRDWYDHSLSDAVSDLLHERLTAVNDGRSPNYQEPGPKMRILSLLQDALKA